MASFEPQDFGLDDPPPRPTTPPLRRGFVLILLVLCLAASLVYGIPYVAEQTGYAYESGRSKAATESLARLDKAGLVNRASELFRMATVAVSPAVVNIQTQKFRRERHRPGLPVGGGARFGRGPVESVGIGSGVVIDKALGYIVTNNHVINGADQIVVRFSQGSEVPARLVGADPKTDLAVIQVRGPLKVDAPWGDSDKMAIGDWVLAIGSPYMLDHTVTAGIVSATGRNNLALPGLEQGGYQDFIQTDAAINPGNSGGPLIDLGGRIIGINTAILTSNSFLRGDDGPAVSGGFEGIGLAIPSSMAKRVVTGLIRDGRVVRGYIGIMLGPPLNASMAKRLKVPDMNGAVVAEVRPNSPALKAGLTAGDVIVKIDGKDVTDPGSLRVRTAEIIPGTDVPIEFFHEGELKKSTVTVAELTAASVPVTLPYGFEVREVAQASGESGGLVVAQVVRGSPAARAGLRPDLPVVAVGPNVVHTLAEFDRAAAAFSPAQGLPLTVRLPDGKTAVVTVGGGQPR